jgi:hypothetical protein
MPYADHEHARAYQREYRRLRRAGDPCTTPRTTLDIPIPIRLKTATDVLELLREQIDAVRAEPKVGAPEKARVIGYLAGIALRAIEAGNLAARIDNLERF